LATTFLESGTDATQDFVFWTATTGTVASDSTVKNTGPRSIALDTGSPAGNSTATKNGVLADAGRRVSLWVRFSDSTPDVNTNIVIFQNTSGNNVYNLVLNTTGVLSNNPVGATAVAGTKVLSDNTWYRITISYTITNTTTFRFELYIDGVFESSATAGTLTRTGTDKFRIASNGGAGANKINRFDDIYIDDGSNYTDPGAVRVTNKRPNANGTNNNFVTQIGAGGSGYGSGHSPQVNEQPLSTTNGWSVVGAGSAVTEEYTIENALTGDVNMNLVSIIDYMGWLYSSSLVSETGQIKVGGVASNIALTSTNTLFLVAAASTAYPAGNTDIGEVTDTTLTTVSLYECGILFAYIPRIISKIVFAKQAVNRASTY